jgi:hypothetical protein
MTEDRGQKSEEKVRVPGRSIALDIGKSLAVAWTGL